MFGRENSVDFLLTPRRKIYTHLQFAELLKTCEDDDRATQVIPVEGLESVALHPKTGRTISGGLQYNRESFADVCGVVCGPLNSCLRRAAEQSDLSTVDQREYLIRAFNMVF